MRYYRKLAPRDKYSCGSGDDQKSWRMNIYKIMPFACRLCCLMSSQGLPHLPSETFDHRLCSIIRNMMVSWSLQQGPKPEAVRIPPPQPSISPPPQTSEMLMKQICTNEQMVLHYGCINFTRSWNNIHVSNCIQCFDSACSELTVILTVFHRLQAVS